jgi:hypothetical protein
LSIEEHEQQVPRDLHGFFGNFGLRFARQQSPDFTVKGARRFGQDYGAQLIPETASYHVKIVEDFIYL